MEPPQIRYCKTSDGVSIAYYAVGTGAPVLVIPPLGASHLVLEYGFPAVKRWYEHMSQHRTLIRWDPRNLGMSERRVQNNGAEEYDLDLDAVFTELAISSADVVASAGMALVALGYAARRPECIRKLVLVNAQPRWIELFPGQPGQAILALAEVDWALFCENAAHGVRGWSQQGGHEYAEFIREAERQDDFLRALPFRREWNVVDLLPLIRADTLVIYGGRWRRRMQQAAMEMASQIAGTRVVEAAGSTDAWMSNEEVRRAIDDFLGIEEDRAGADHDVVSSSTAIILFADIADSTALTERLGDAAFRDKARALDEALREAISSNGGTPIEGKLLGDGVLATFGAAREAIACAGAIHEAGRHAGLPLHVGIHAGDVIREEGNVFGGAVNIASRVAGEAGAGETLVSATVRELARTSAGVSFEDRGERALKGVTDAVRVWRVVGA